MKPLVMLLLGLAMTAQVHAPDATAPWDWDDLVEAGQDFFAAEYRSPNLEALPEVDQDQVRRFFQELQARLRGDYVADLAVLKATLKGCCLCWSHMRKPNLTPSGLKRGWTISRSPSNTSPVNHPQSRAGAAAPTGSQSGTRNRTAPLASAARGAARAHGRRETGRPIETHFPGAKNTR